MNHNLPSAELILFNGDFYTQDVARPRARAVAIAAGRIMAVGSDEEIRNLAGPETELINLDGRLGLPGLMDSHFHYYDWAMGRKSLTLSDVRSFTELLDSVSRAVGKAEPDSWILGQGWNEADWPENRMPTRSDLDAIAPAHPVLLWRCDLHLAVANSKALEQAGMTDDSADPTEGTIDRDQSGRPNGILRERAANMVKEVIALPDENILAEAMRDGIAVLHSLGITGLHDARLMGEVQGARTFRVWQRLREANELNLRCWVSIPSESLNEAIALGLRTGFGDDRLRIGHVKFFADGGMGARTAWLLEPYADANCGMSLIPVEELTEAVQRADGAGLAVMIHAIGDRANQEVVTLYEKLEANRRTGLTASAQPTVSHRIEHLQMVRPEDLKRLAELGVVACVQPNNMIIDINMIDESVGSRGRWAYPFRSILDAGVPMIFSSDAPVCNPSPLLGIHAAATRRRKDGTPGAGWHPEQQITVAEAVRSFTVAPAAAYGLENELGSITPGKFADLIVLDRNIYTIDPMQIPETQVEITIFDGKVMFRTN